MMMQIVNVNLERTAFCKIMHGFIQGNMIIPFGAVVAVSVQYRSHSVEYLNGSALCGAVVFVYQSVFFYGCNCTKFAWICGFHILRTDMKRFAAGAIIIPATHVSAKLSSFHNRS